MELFLSLALGGGVVGDMHLHVCFCFCFQVGTSKNTAEGSSKTKRREEGEEGERRGCQQTKLFPPCKVTGWTEVLRCGGFVLPKHKDGPTQKKRSYGVGCVGGILFPNCV